MDSVQGFVPMWRYFCASPDKPVLLDKAYAANNKLQAPNDKQDPNHNAQTSNKIQSHLINPI